MNNLKDFCESFYQNLFKISELDKINKYNNLLTRKNSEITYKKTHLIIDIGNITNYQKLIIYPSKINLKIQLIDIYEKLDDIILPTKSQIINNFNELLYYINIFIDVKNQSYILKQSSLEDNWIINNIQLILYNNMKYILKLNKKNDIDYLNLYKVIYDKYINDIDYLNKLYFILYIKYKKQYINMNKYNIYIYYMNYYYYIWTLKPSIYKAIMIYKNLYLNIGNKEENKIKIYIIIIFIMLLPLIELLIIHNI